MPITWYAARGGGAVAVDTSETSGVSVGIGLSELCELASTATGGELVVAASAAGVPAVIRVAAVCEAASTGGELVVVASSLAVSAVARVDELCEAVSTGGGLVVFTSAVAGVGDVATDRLFG